MRGCRWALCLLIILLAGCHIDGMIVYQVGVHTKNTHEADKLLYALLTGEVRVEDISFRDRERIRATLLLHTQKADEIYQWFLQRGLPPMDGMTEDLTDPMAGYTHWEETWGTTKELPALPRTELEAY